MNTDASDRNESVEYVRNERDRGYPTMFRASGKTISDMLDEIDALRSEIEPLRNMLRTATDHSAALQGEVESLRAAGTAVPQWEHHKLDNDKQVFFYEQNFYILSNFSAFNLLWRDRLFSTSEAAYHFEKFVWEHAGTACFQIADLIRSAPSAHEAFKIAERYRQHRRPDWDEVKVGIMRNILRAKVVQHEYVRRKLLATGDRELIEDSWRDDFWGWGPNKDGQNMLGKLWMEVRAELRALQPQEPPA